MLGFLPYSPRWQSQIGRLLAGAFVLAAALVWCRLLWPEVQPPGPARWPEAIFLLTAAGLLLHGLTEEVPAQNVALVALVVSAAGSGLHWLSGMMPVRLAAFTAGAWLGPSLLPGLPWTVPALWVVLLLGSRGIARLALARRRDRRAYGYEVIALASVLAIGLAAGIEFLAASAAPDTSNSLAGAAVNLLGWLVAVPALLGVFTPSLINKRPGAPPRANAAPAFVIPAICVILFTLAAMQGLWVPALLFGAGGLGLGWAAAATRAIAE